MYEQLHRQAQAEERGCEALQAECLCIWLITDLLACAPQIEVMMTAQACSDARQFLLSGCSA